MHRAVSAGPCVVTVGVGAFDPADAACWIAHGRRADHAQILASVWTDYPDLPSHAPLDERMARSRARVAALRPFNDTIRKEAERDRQRANFACIENRVAKGSEQPCDQAILNGRDLHGYDWNAAVRYANGWYAAHAGWPPRDFSTRQGEISPAYAQGFRDGGGCFDDLFDAARRAYAAAARKAEQLAFPLHPALSRPLPSSWPLPTDGPRPSRWSKRILIIGATIASDASRGLMEMLQAQDGHQAGKIIIAAAARGFHLWQAGLSAEIAKPSDQLRALLAGVEPDDLLVMAEGDDLAWIDGHASLLPLCRTMERTRNSPIQQRVQFRAWLDRGLGDGEMMASGHIRWTKIAQGLSGRLGEFVTRSAGPAEPRGHRIVVELRNGTPALGFMTPQGEPLVPETVITNKAHLRKAMTIMLRRFAAAIPQHHAIAA